MGKIILLKKAINILNDFGFNITLGEVIERYSETNRHWHTISHIYYMLQGILELYVDKKITEREYCILVIAAIFHDIIYDTKRKDNEEKSVDFMMSKYDESTIDKEKFPSDWRNNQDLDKIKEVILNTKTHDSKDGICKKFNKLDTWILDAQFIDMLDWENKIYLEYKWVGWKKYKQKRIDFLLRSIKDHTHNVINIKNLIDYIRKKQPKIGLIYYEVDKLPDIEKYIKDIKKMNTLFDLISIVIIHDTNRVDKSKISQYSKNSQNNEFHYFNETEFISYLSHQKNITIVKEIQYLNNYNKDIDRHIIENFDIKIIYI